MQADPLSKIFKRWKTCKYRPKVRGILYPKPTELVNFMKPRNFLGNIHYISAETCAPTPAPTVLSVVPPTPMPVEPYLQPITTRVMYTFNLQYQTELQEEEVMSTVDSTVRDVLDGTLRQFGTDLNWLAEYHNFNVAGILSFPVQSQEGEIINLFDSCFVASFCMIIHVSTMYR